MSHIDNIRDQLDRKDYQSLWFTPRLEHLWRTLKQCAISYQSLEREHKDVSNHFEQLFKLLMAQEHKLKTPINSQMSHIQSTINEITDEIMFVNATRNMTAYTANDEINGSKEHLSALISSISSCHSIEQFIYNQSATISNDNIVVYDNFNGNDSYRTKLNDNELLLLITRHVKHISQSQYHKESLFETCRVDIDVALFMDIKMQIESCFVLLDSDTQRKNNHFVCLKSSQVCHYNLGAPNWKTIRETFPRPIEASPTTLVYSRGSIYSFGLVDGQTVCARYSFCDRRAFYYDIKAFAGEKYVSACYDGSRNIYLLGGATEQRKFNRVDCFDITTKRIKLVGYMDSVKNNPPPLTYFRNNLIYVVGALSNSMARTMATFDVENLITTIEISLPGSITGAIMSCFDGLDRIFYKDRDSIKTYSMSNKGTTRYASKCPVDGNLVELGDNVDVICFALTCKTLYSNRSKLMTVNLAPSLKGTVIPILKAAQSIATTNSLSDIIAMSNNNNNNNMISQSITFSNDFNEQIPIGLIPTSVTVINFGNSFNQTLPQGSLPPGLTDVSFGYHFNQPLDIGSLPSTLISCHFGSSEYDQEITTDWLPQSLQTLGFGDNFNQPLSAPSSSSSSSLVLPPSLTVLSLGENFNQPLSKDALPVTINYLRFGRKFNHPLSPGVIPHGLNWLIMGSQFNHIIKPGDLPSSITVFSLGNSYNQLFEAGALPSSLLRLRIMGLYDKQFIPGCSLPNSLQELTVGPAFNQAFIPGSLPYSFQTLRLYGNYNHPFPHGTLPASLTDLVLSAVNHPIIPGQLPDKLLSIFFGPSFDQPLAPGCLPSSVTKVKMSQSFNQPIVKGVLPHSITCLDFGYMFNKPLDPGVLPSGLSELSFGHWFDIKFVHGSLPTTLTSMTFGASFNQQLDEGVLPDSITILNFGKKYNQPFKPGMLPRSLSTLSFCQAYDQQLLPGSIPQSLSDLTINAQSIGEPCKLQPFLTECLMRLRLHIPSEYTTSQVGSASMPFLPYHPNIHTYTLLQGSIDIHIRILDQLHSLVLDEILQGYICKTSSIFNTKEYPM
ncbi:hypothetical protein SAMD00019534_063600 [Acytostelium subglobosum LB1]|uniref:hypothetical protein n=1 Tax=Acytostelium subglobosum LB1 TaxID=1410327 RepID=UPI000644DDF9|nr:hypothetical protein SAMD00019534_063600 [Acytostelium subglobosum LB1]GAM23185.1 hypothetical protein SAMD00019534_063600 [Acytostelium subglobosum LB1]|eukprot:XP_012753634.1 hypothetical protein SAMD00019534_063600 [Acytostelium subglobosum LB1]